MGTAAEYICLNADLVTELPSHVTFAEGATLGDRKRAQSDMARFIATPGRMLSVDGTFSLYETAAAHPFVEQGGKVGTVVVEPQK